MEGLIHEIFKTKTSTYRAPLSMFYCATCIIMEDQKQMFKDLHLAFFLIVVIDHKILRKMIYRTSQEGCI